MLNPLVQAARELSARVDGLRFGAPVAYVYNPLEYARAAHEQYLTRWGGGRKRALFLGMNPGPWGMAQTGVPFGQVHVVREWLRLDAPIGRPIREHPGRPVDGFACKRSEVSGQRLWGLFRARFDRPERFFAAHFVTNYCPLLFLEANGRNRTPDKLPAGEREPLLVACDEHLRTCCAVFGPDFVIGVGRFAADRALIALRDTGVQVAAILHPSPASPTANRGWAVQAAQQLEALGIWSSCTLAVRTPTPGRAAATRVESRPES
jgi:single-strand selective monofunctional uracil DNA glycosylase